MLRRNSGLPRSCAGGAPPGDGLRAVVTVPEPTHISGELDIRILPHDVVGVVGIFLSIGALNEASRCGVNYRFPSERKRSPNSHRRPEAIDGVEVRQRPLLPTSVFPRIPQAQD